MNIPTKRMITCDSTEMPYFTSKEETMKGVLFEPGPPVAFDFMEIICMESRIAWLRGQKFASGEMIPHNHATLIWLKGKEKPILVMGELVENLEKWTAMVNKSFEAKK